MTPAHRRATIATPRERSSASGGPASRLRRACRRRGRPFRYTRDGDPPVRVLARSELAVGDEAELCGARSWLPLCRPSSHQLVAAALGGQRREAGLISRGDLAGDVATDSWRERCARARRRQRSSVLLVANTGALGSPAASPAFVLAQASAAKACTWLPMSRERQRSTAALASTLAASEARVRSIAARSRGFSPPSRRMTVIAAKRSPDGKRFASVSSRTDSEEPGRNEDPSFFCTSWRRCANEPPGAPRMSHKRMIAMRAGRELKRRSRALMWAQVRGLLRRRVGALGRS